MISKIKRAVKKYGPAELALRLGYRSSSTITNWIKRGAVPRMASYRVEQLLKELKVK